MKLHDIANISMNTKPSPADEFMEILNRRPEQAGGPVQE